MTHTPECWETENYVIRREGLTGYQIGMFEIRIPHPLGLDHDAAYDEAVANAERAVACVNALAGIPTDKLRPGIVRELIAAARLAHGVVPAGGDGTYKYVDAAPLRALLRELGSE